MRYKKTYDRKARVRSYKPGEYVLFLLVLVPKRNGSILFCIDYRRLNKLTVFDPEPMNQHEDIFAKLKTDQYTTRKSIYLKVIGG